ncbi:MAG: response regulator, partial [Pirellulaceae bacterium]
MTPESDRVHESLILVVDDSRIDLGVAVHLLTKRPRTRVLAARDAKTALSEIEQHRPDLVITDMQMPEMDGFELVETINARFPYLPTVLMTAHGSDEIAMRALHGGAASFVRKQDPPDRLLETVDEVLALTVGRRQQHRLWNAWLQTEFQWQLENDPSLISILVSHLRHYLSSLADHNETVF